MRFVPIALALLACGPGQAEVDDLTRRVNTLEQRVRRLEGPATPSGRAKQKSRAARGGSGTIEVLGDASKVFLRSDEDRIAVPGTAATDTYVILAVFEGSEPVKAGSLTVQDGQVHTITCDASTRLCEAR